MKDHCMVKLGSTGELKTDLEVGVGEDVGGGIEVLDLLEGGHDLGSDDATLLVDQLDGGLPAVVSDAVADLPFKSLLVYQFS